MSKRNYILARNVREYVMYTVDAGDLTARDLDALDAGEGGYFDCEIPGIEVLLDKGEVSRKTEAYPTDDPEYHYFLGFTEEAT